MPDTNDSGNTSYHFYQLESIRLNFKCNDFTAICEFNFIELRSKHHNSMFLEARD